MHAALSLDTQFVLGGMGGMGGGSALVALAALVAAGTMSCEQLKLILRAALCRLSHSCEGHLLRREACNPNPRPWGRSCVQARGH